MGSFNNYLEDEILDHIFSGATWSAPASTYIGLSTADPTDDASGVAEPSGNGYARVNFTNNATNWPAASGGAKANGVAVTFPEASGSWGTITHFFINDAATAGNYLAHGALTASKVVDSGDTISFPIGDIDITLD